MIPFERLSRRTHLAQLGSGPLASIAGCHVAAGLDGSVQVHAFAIVSGTTPTVVVLLYSERREYYYEWVPQDAGPNYTLSPTLEVLKPHRADFTVLSGLGHPHSQGGHSGADTWLTSADLKAVPGADYTNTISADQIVAEHHGKQTRFASLQLSDQSGTGSAGHSHTLSFDGRGTPLPAENSPRRLFERLFVPESASDRQATLRTAMPSESRSSTASARKPIRFRRNSDRTIAARSMSISRPCGKPSSTFRADGSLGGCSEGEG